MSRDEGQATDEDAWSAKIEREFHETIVRPTDDVIVWRYFDFPRFVSLLETSSLWFAAAVRLGDPYEGTLTAETVVRRRGYTSAINLPGNAPPPEAVEATLSHLQRMTARCAYVSCWHANSVESAAMWHIYAPRGQGIAVRSTLGALAGSLEAAAQLSTPSRAAAPPLVIGCVRYLDYDGKDAIPGGNVLFPLFHKQKSFEHEREVRLVDLDMKAVLQAVTDPAMATAAGVAHKVILDRLIQAVFIAPEAEPWLTDLVNSVMRRYELSLRSTQSRMGVDPVY
jgi:hypothetical protein